jgi:simple sugar transport system ATP-binding protein
MTPPLLDMRNIRKAYGPVRVLDDISLGLQPGEVRCLAGENGSGKSTLIKILSGVVPADGGTVELGGKPLEPRADVAIAAGLSVIYQDFSLFPNLSAGENITFLKAVARGDRIRHPLELRKLAAATLKRMNVAIDLDAPVEALPVAQKQLVAIARALANDARIIVMDEPTTALTRSEVQSLIRIVAALKADGVAFLFVSHKIEEIFAICDTITVLRDGKVVAEGPAGDFDHARIVSAMTGRTVDRQRLARTPSPQAAPVVETVGLTRRGEYADVSIAFRPGEIVALVGLLGSGRTEFALTLFGEIQPDRGEIRIAGAPARLGSMIDAVDAGIAYVPEDRLSEGLFLGQPISENIGVASLEKDAPRGWLGFGALRRRAEAAVQRLRIKAPFVTAPVATLSGGNQQRVVLARWMERAPRFLILNGPTVGVDIGSKREIHELLLALSRSGTAVMVVTDDIGEAIALADRVLVMVGGRITASFDGETVDEATLNAEVSREAA